MKFKLIFLTVALLIIDIFIIISVITSLFSASSIAAFAWIIALPFSIFVYIFILVSVILDNTMGKYLRDEHNSLNYPEIEETK